MATLEEKLAARAKLTGGSGQKTLADKLAARGIGAAPSEPIFSGGTFSDILDVLSIPQYAATGALSGKKTVGEAIKERYTPSKAMGINSPLGAFLTDVILDPLNFLAGAGLTAKGAKAVKEGKAAATLAGAAAEGERALLTLSAPFASSGIPLVRGKGVLAGATKLADKVKSLPGVGRALQALGAVPASATGTLDDIEATAKGFKEAKAIRATAKGVERSSQAFVINKALKLKEQAEPLLKSGKITKDDMADIVESVANKKNTIVLKPELKELADAWRGEIEEMTRLWEKLGGPRLTNKTVKNLLTKEAKAALDVKKGVGGGARVAGGRAGSEEFAEYTMARALDGSKESLIKFDGATKGRLQDGTRLKKISENMYGTQAAFTAIQRAKYEARLVANATTKTVQEAVAKAIAELPGSQIFMREAASPRQINTGFKTVKFSEDPIEILLAQGLDTARLVGRQNLVDNIKGMDIAIDAGAGKKIPDDYRRLRTKGLEKVALPKMVADHVEATIKAYSSIEDVNDFVKTYDKILNTWKGAATFVNPAFHSRNFVGNLWNLYLSGMNNPLDMIKGNQIEWAIRKGFKESPDDVLKFVPKQYRKFVDEFVNKQGLRSSGAFSADIDKDAVAKFMDNPFVNGAGAVGEFLENGSKLSLYLSRRAKGFAPKVAAQDVRKFLFDYGDLTDFEKNVMKRIFPFYTWTRKNLPLQIAMLIERPTRISAVAKAKAAIDSMTEGEPMEEKYIPEWLKEAYPIYFGKDKNGLQKFLKLEGFIPSVDLNKLGRPEEVPMEMLSPLIKTPIELFSNYDFFYEKEISEYAGQKVAEPIPFTSKSVPVNAYGSKLIDLVRPVSELQKFSYNPDRTGSAPSTQGKLLNYLVGKTYDLDPQKQKAAFNYRKNMEAADVRSDIKKTASSDEKARLKKILKSILAGEGITL